MNQKLYGTVLLKATDILNYIYQSSTAPTLKDINLNTKISKPTILKILKTLEYCGFVKSNGKIKKYYLGTKFIKYGDKATKDFDIVDIAMPLLSELRDQTTEAVNLGIAENNRIILLKRANSTNNIRFELTLGESMPMYCSAMGKAILSVWPENRQKEYLKKVTLIRQTQNTITSPDKLLNEIEKIRRRHYAIDNIENQDGIYCIGFPLNKGDHILGAFSISAPIFRLNDEKIKNWIDYGLETRRKILEKF